MILTLLFPLLLSFNAFARKASVLVVDPDIETQELEKSFKVEKPKSYTAIPNKNKRDEVMDDFEVIKGWDELKKDMLYMDLGNKSFEELLKKYPELTPGQIRTMIRRK